MICHIIASIVNAGPSEVAELIAKQLATKTSDVVAIITLYQGNDKARIKELKTVGVRLYSLNYTSRVDLLCDYVSGRLQIRLSKILTQDDIVHTHGFLPDMIAWRCVKSKRKVATVHSRQFEDYVAAFGWPLGICMARLSVSSYRCFSAVCAVSNAVKDHLKIHGIESVVIRNSVKQHNESSLRSDIKQFLDKYDVRFVYAGHLSRQKNVSQLVELFNEYRAPGECLLLLGEGAYFDTIRKNNYPNIKVAGFVPNAVPYIAYCNIYVSHSHTEGCSLSVLQAVNAGLVLLLSDIPAHREVVDYAGIYGVCFDKTSYGRSHQEASRFSRSKLASSMPDDYSIDTTVTQYLDVYESV